MLMYINLTNLARNMFPGSSNFNSSNGLADVVLGSASKTPISNILEPAFFSSLPTVHSMIIFVCINRGQSPTEGGTRGEEVGQGQGPLKDSPVLMYLPGLEGTGTGLVDMRKLLESGLNLAKSLLSEMGQCTTAYPYNQLFGALVLKNYERQDETLLS
uniref:Uncharacterized protein n=1 Tax=Lactuca sativa TaxID=4236 RepID=A0A9R1V655_LACSA|nr:hypothetical protein LSAT_V11C600301890 [Lactuca sativa]